MVELAVYLIRDGLNVLEEEQGGPPDISELPNMNTLMKPNAALLKELTRMIDPALSPKGYKQAEDTFRSMALVFHNDGTERNIAFFSSPFRSCTSSALMISVAGFEPQDWSDWGLSTPSTRHAPTAIPIIVVNELCDDHPGIRQMGGWKVVLEAGLLHCAAFHWNKAYRKDPIAGVIRSMKDVVQERIKEWVDTKPDPNSHFDIHFAADSQYLRFEENNDPYSLTHMSLKFNIVTDLLKPNKILDPHRKGIYHSNPPPTPESEAFVELERAIHVARAGGCDSVMFMCTEDLISSVLKKVGRGDTSIAPGQMFSFLCQVKGKKRYHPEEPHDWKYYGQADCGQAAPDLIPPFTGPIKPSIQMPPDMKKAFDEAGTSEHWGSFPPPEPEIIPDNYPSGIPPFSSALRLPPPEEDWAWVHINGKPDGAGRITD